MSTGGECDLFQLAEDRWYYAIERRRRYYVDIETGGDRHAGFADWRMEDPILAGPFATMDRAQEHLSANHVNPGGLTVIPMENAADDPVYQYLAQAAEQNPAPTPAT